MEIDDSLLTLFHSQVTSTEGGYLIEIPKSEVETGRLTEGNIYRVALLQALEDKDSSGKSVKQRQPSDDAIAETRAPLPPVSEGEHRSVQIESEGREGDGVAFINSGFAVFVPGAEVGEELEVEIQTVHDRYAFAEPTNGRPADDVRT